MKIIINADDFGINEVVTSEIERMIELGAISSTTIMANGACLPEVKRFADLHPEVSFGIHFCISEFKSITKSQTFYKYGLLNDDGTFVKHKIFSLENYPEDLRDAIHEELEIQVLILKNLGIRISHADSHHHSHTIPEISDIFANVMMRNGIKKVRLGMQPDIAYMITKKFATKNQLNNSKTHNTHHAQQIGTVKRVSIFNRLYGYAKMLYKRVCLNKTLRKHFIAVDRFFPYEEFYLRFKSFEDSDKTYELMCHPGHPGPDYRREMKLVEDKVLLGLNNVSLVNYEEI